MGMMISHDMLLGRWRLSLELFGRVFMEDVGAEPGSVHSVSEYSFKLSDGCNHPHISPLFILFEMLLIPKLSFFFYFNMKHLFCNELDLLIRLSIS